MHPRRTRKECGVEPTLPHTRACCCSSRARIHPAACSNVVHSRTVPAVHSGGRCEHGRGGSATTAAEGRNPRIFCRFWGLGGKNATVPAPPKPQRSATSGRAGSTTHRGIYAGDLMRRRRQGCTGAGGAGIRAKPLSFPRTISGSGIDAEKVLWGGGRGRIQVDAGGVRPGLVHAKHANGDGESTIPGCRGREVGLLTRAMSSLSPKPIG